METQQNEARTPFHDGGRNYERPSSQVEKNRTCTDCLFLPIFLVAYVVLGLVGIQAVREGNLQILENFAHGKNFRGERCGVDDAVKNFKLTYFTVTAGTTDYITSHRTRLMPILKPVCTNACPNIQGAGGAVTAYNRTESNACQAAAQEAGLCTWYGVKAYRIANYCLDVSLLSDGTVRSFQTFLSDLRSSSGFIAVVFFFALLVGAAWLLFIRLCAKVLVWVTLIGTISGLVVFGFYLFKHAAEIHEDMANGYFRENDVRIAAYVIWGVGAVLALIVMCSVRSIAAAASILQTATLFLADVKSAMLLPFLNALLQLVTLLLFCDLLANAGSAAMKSSEVKLLSVNVNGGNSTQETACIYDNDYLNPFCVDWKRGSHVSIVAVFILLMYFWSASLLHAFDVFILAYASGKWYRSPYENGKKKLDGFLCGANTVCDFKLLFCGFCAGIQQIGSLALGSLVMAICKMLVVLCKWAQKKEGAHPNPVMKVVWRVVTCLAVCLERTARLVTDNAYISMAIQGKDFCTSCRIGLGIMVREPVLSACVAGCSRIFSLIGPMAVMMLTGLLSWCMLDQHHHLPKYLIAEPLESPYAPMAAVLVLSFCVGSLMMNPYSVVSTAIMQAFLADKEEDQCDRHQDQRTHGFEPHTPPPLQDFVRERGP